MKKILFVCTGNTCRSPMAEGFLKNALDRNGLSAIYTAASAGISAADGSPAHINAVRVMREDWNLDISGHSSSGITESDIEDSFLILTMKESHKEYLISLCPNDAQKIYTLKEYSYYTGIDSPYEGSDNSLDIQDPFDKPAAVYSSSAAEIKRAVDKLTHKLKKLQEE